MSIGLADLCEELRNYGFNVPTDEIPKFHGRYVVEGGNINLEKLVSKGELVNGQYFRIVGSVFNDGVYRYPTSGLADETFDGSIWTLRIPPEVVTLLDDINTWLVNNEAILNSPYQSESIGGYSYSKASSSSGSGTGSFSWKDQFMTRLNRWRKQRKY